MFLHARLNGSVRNGSLSKGLLRWFIISVTTCTALIGSMVTQAQTQFPSKPVRLIVPAPAGSSLDIVARLLADKFKDDWSQPVVVENRPGAGGMIGVDLAAKAAPDGHTIVIGFPGPTAFAPFLYSKVPYDTVKDLLAVVKTTSQPNVLAVNAGVPAKTPKELVAWARTQSKLNYASVGAGSSSHLSMELFKTRGGFDAQHVPFNGAPPAALSLAAGDTQLLFAVASGIMPQVKSGKLRILAVTSKTRFEPLKEYPTIAESGFPQFEADAWNGLFVAAGTPATVVQTINQAVNKALGQTDVNARLFALGMAPGGGSSEAFKGQIARDATFWGAMITRLNVRIE